jgi:glycosyltransferase involved in cell wall biosynthesis
MALRVSVALCTFNGERFLGEQLASIAAQTRQPAELVVTDDASSDGTLAVLEGFAAKAPFPVRIRRNPENRGSTASFEQTIAGCEGSLIALCDQDDFWRPQKLERLASALENDPHAGYVFSDAEVVDERLRPLGFRMWETVGLADDGWRDFQGQRQIEQLLERTRVTGATLMIRADLLHLCRPFPRRIVHDRWLVMVLSAVGAHGIALNEPLIEYRQHPGQQIGTVHAGRRPGLSVQASSDFVLAQRRRMRLELVLGEHFIAQIDRLTAQRGLLSDARLLQARASRTLAQGWVRHVAARTGLSEASAVRVAMTIAREWARGGYRRYSGGPRALASDLLYCLCYRSRDVAASRAVG